jgi:tetratricopeptide (TPR) repeat protein
LLALILGTQAAPSRTTVHRWVEAAANAAGRVLQRLGTPCKSLVSTACLDEIFFHGRPVLVGVEPQSMTLIMAQKEDRLDRAAWVKNLVGWDALDYVVGDAGTVLQAALSWLAARRRAVGTTLEVSLDVFHTTKEARRVLKILWNQVKKGWKAAEKADLRVARFKRRGQYAYRPAAAACAAWARVAKSMQRYDQARAAWQMAKEALELFRPEGRLNDRAWAQARVHEALPGLAGKPWTTLRHLLEAPEAFTFLDQLQARLAQQPVTAELSEALVRLWWLRQLRADDQGQKAKAILVQELVCWKLDPRWPIWYSKVAGLLRTTVRASSVVESVNSVLRMHQSRHRSLNQGLLNLKRLYWNTRRFRRGRRRGQCPYQLLGVSSSSYDFWTLVQTEIARSTLDDGDKEKQHPKAA